MYRLGVAIIVFWCVLAFIYAGTHDFWGDEISSLIGSSEDLSAIIYGGGSDFHPPLYFLILHGWMRVFGTSESGLRSLSILCSGCTMFLVLVLSFQLRLKRKHLPVILLALSPFWMQFSCMARYYSLSAMVFCAFLWFFLRTRGSPSLYAVLLCGILLALTGYTNYIVFGVSFIVVLSEVFTSRDNRARRNMAILCMIALLCMLPLVSLVIRQTRGMVSWGQSSQFATLIPTLAISIIYPIYSFSVSETVMPWSVWASIPGLCIVFLLLYRARRNVFLARLLIIGLLFGIGVISVVARSLPLVYVPSRLLFLLPIWMMLLSEGYATVRFKRWGGLILGVLFAVYVYGGVNLVSGKEYHNSTYIVPWKTIVQTIREDPESNHLVITTEEYPLFHYGPDLRYQLVRPGYDVISELENKFPAVIWLVERDRADPQRRMLLDPLERWLVRKYNRDREFHYLPRSAWERKVREIVQRVHVEPEAVRLTRFKRTW